MRKIWPAILIGIIIVLVGVAAYLYGQNQGFIKKEVSQNTTTNTDARVMISPTGSVPTAVNEIQTITKTPTPIAVIEAEGSFPAQDVSELKARVINPFLDYHATESGMSLVSFKVSKNLGASQDTYPYQADAIFSNGGNEGFLIQKYNGHISWWVPGCLNGCKLSEAYKTKYPEIAKQVE